MKQKLKLADYVTFLNAASALFSMFYAIEGMFSVSAGLLILCFVLDYLDGKVARMSKTENAYGKQLDSLSDIVAFGVAPAVLGYCYVVNINRIVLVLFIVAGIHRLAKYNITEFTGYYKGMPITTNALIFSIMYFSGVSVQAWVFVYALAAVLMVAPFKVKKVFT